jgi:hypothetical protein
MPSSASKRAGAGGARWSAELGRPEAVAHHIPGRRGGVEQVGRDAEHADHEEAPAQAGHAPRLLDAEVERQQHQFEDIGHIGQAADQVEEHHGVAREVLGQRQAAAERLDAEPTQLGVVEVGDVDATAQRGEEAAVVVGQPGEAERQRAPGEHADPRRQPGQPDEDRGHQQMLAAKAHRQRRDQQLQRKGDQGDPAPAGQHARDAPFLGPGPALSGRRSGHLGAAR